MTNHVAEDLFHLNTKVTLNEAQSIAERLSFWKYGTVINLHYHIKSVLQRPLEDFEMEDW